MSNEGKSRRAFLVDSVSGMTGLSTVWLLSNYSGILEAEEYAQKAAEKWNTTPRLGFFTEEQAADVDAMASQIIPTDDSPGAHEARVVFFIDRALVTFAQDAKPVYIQGLKDLQAKTKELFPSATKFSALTAPQQIQVLTAIEKSPFFNTVRNHTVIGFFANPIHGGNHNKVGFKLIGFDDSLEFKPPFGYYDAKPQPRRR
jgi:gluconate 2-dehydrogenase gamma chain